MITSEHTPPPPRLQFILRAMDLNTMLGKFKWKNVTQKLFIWIMETEY